MIPEERLEFVDESGPNENAEDAENLPEVQDDTPVERETVGDFQPSKPLMMDNETPEVAAS